MSIESLSPVRAGRAMRYDSWTIALHWFSALLVIALFASAITWDYLPRGTPLRKSLQSLHISMGILLSVIFIARVFWRSTGGRKLAALETGIQRILSKSVHHLLYLLLAAQIVLGYLFRWAQGEPFMFFGLFSIPNPIGENKELGHWYSSTHYYVGWTIIILACGHAVAALAHHYLMRDGVLRRMLPARV
ncbi:MULTISPECIES: cytochrome b [unclassified Rhizobium]|uniref:cytochrome b n=1 Tax=unclassified Rhizobium TaxID=2613769 RepID=UPI001ADA950D|nr:MULTISPECIES: cytochrome b [unclassified Rhizobium]MBO9098026.1 cytochrome b [Rhizobium sp. L58/93]MBO9133191.1 cytochrome b [Rhizobium sp. B209b/85]MBO9168177.1 cytochrome b [Rhizobium sp. L245/93]MBO9184222.1 cytochrome b [Rhizobium sp. E27B/91]QXZ84426.1 cytochrome b [Rhizobium sp. K1/93]